MGSASWVGMPLGVRKNVKEFCSGWRVVTLYLLYWSVLSVQIVS